MIDQFKNMLDSIQNKKDGDASQEGPNKELIKFDLGVLDKYPSVEIHYTISESTFGIKDVTTQKSPKEVKSLRSNSLLIHSNSEKIVSLYNQLKRFEKSTRKEKYSRILNQSKLLLMYKEKGMDPEFIENMKSSIASEYEFQINWNPQKANGTSKDMIKLYVTGQDVLKEIERELELFRERSYNYILEKVVEDLKD